MNIWHSGANCSPEGVNGVNSLIYTIAAEQARLGHEVSLIIYGSPDEAAQRYSRETGVRFVGFPMGLIRQFSYVASALRIEQPDIVHTHSVFIPHQAVLCAALRKRAIPFVITPSGGLSPYVLGRSRWKKKLYSSLIERYRFKNAAGISVVTPKETSEVLAFVPHFEGSISFIPNAVEISPLQGRSWSPPPSPKVIYLGRFDIVGKGLDLLLQIARNLPAVEFHLYGPDDDVSKKAIAILVGSCSRNVHLHPPVYGTEKAAVLAESTLYLQMSRWEAFGISIAEAMCLGLPCAVASTAHISSIIEEHGLGLVLPADLSDASDLIWKTVSDPNLLKMWSEKATRFATRNFQAQAVAQQFLEFYRSVKFA